MTMYIFDNERMKIELICYNNIIVVIVVLNDWRMVEKNTASSIACW